MSPTIQYLPKDVHSALSVSSSQNRRENKPNDFAPKGTVESFLFDSEHHFDFLQSPVEANAVMKEIVIERVNTEPRKVQLSARPEIENALNVNSKALL